MVCMFMRVLHKYAVLNETEWNFDKYLTYLTKFSEMPLYKGILASEVSRRYLTQTSLDTSLEVR